jgi:uncharacterized protein YkwD
MRTLVFIAAISTAAAAQEVPRSPAAVAEAAAGRVMEGTNAFRKAQGLAALAADGTLEKTALDFASFMARTGKYGHGADGRMPFRRAVAHGYEACIVAENIAYQYRSSGYAADELAAALVEGWKHSPEHRKNMLDPALTETGVGIAQGAEGRYFAVQLFGRPKRAALRFSVENAGAESVRYTLGGREYRLGPRVTHTHVQCRAQELALPERTLMPEDGARYAAGG